MTDSLVYSLAHETAPGLLASSGAPTELIVRRSTLMVPESTLSGSRLFVLSSLEDRAVFCLAAQVGAAFEIEEGRFAGEILLQLSPERTIQTTSLGLAHNWVVADPSIEFGVLTRCPLALEQRLELLLRSGWVTRTAVPQPSQRRRQWSGPFTHVAVRALVAEVLRDRPLDSLERHYLHKSLSPIGSESFRRIELTDQARAVELATIIAFHDPLVMQGPTLPTPTVDRVVDGALVPVNPDSVVARRFLQTGGEADLRARLEKVERAEGVHQRTVRRLARGIAAIGLTPLASTSVDLAFALRGGLVLLEVKSIHPENFESQLLSAVGQLLFYESEIAETVNSSAVRGHIILASESPLLIPATCYRLANRAGVGLEHVVVANAEESPLVDLAERLVARGLWER